MLREGWYVPNSIDATVKNFISAADPVYVDSASPVDFEKQLIHEFRSLAVFPADEEKAVENYIHQNLGQLYEYARTILSGRASHPRGSRRSG